MDDETGLDHRLWWEREAERMLRDLLLFPVPVEDMGWTTELDEPDVAW